jgi:hypothetical protein
MKTLRSIAALAFLPLLLAMAKKPPEERPPMTDPAALLVSDRADGPANWSGGFGPAGDGTVVVRDEESWKRLWTERFGQKEVPPVDFSEHIAVAVFLGTRNTGGYSVEFLPPTREGDTIVLGYRERKPAPGGFVIQAFTQPFGVQLYRKPATPVEVRAR